MDVYNISSLYLGSWRSFDILNATKGHFSRHSSEFYNLMDERLKKIFIECAEG